MVRVSVEYSEELIRDLRKCDIHVHLGGSMRAESLIEMAQERGVGLPAETPEGLRREVFNLDMKLGKNGTVLAEEIMKALSSLNGWGSLEIYVQDNKVTQITKRAISKTSHDLKEEHSVLHK